MPSNPRDAKQPTQDKSGSESYSGMNAGIEGSSPSGATKETYYIYYIITLPGSSGGERRSVKP